MCFLVSGFADKEGCSVWTGRSEKAGHCFGRLEFGRAGAGPGEAGSSEWPGAPVDSGVRGGRRGCEGGSEETKRLYFYPSGTVQERGPFYVLPAAGPRQKKKKGMMGTAEGIWTDPLYLSNAIAEMEPWRFGCSRMEEGAGQFMAILMQDPPLPWPGLRKLQSV